VLTSDFGFYMSRIFYFCIDSIFVFAIDFGFQRSNGDVLSIFLGVCQLMCLGALVMMPAPPSSSRNCHIDNCYFIHLLIFIPFLIISKDTTVHCGLWWPCMLIGFCKFIDRDVLRKKNYTLVSWAKHVSITIIYLCYA